MDISKLDINFSSSDARNETYKYYSVFDSPFILEGFPWHKTNGDFYRLPKEKAYLFSESIRELAYNTSGGAVSFCTDSPKISISAKIHHYGNMNHIPRTGEQGFDIYIKKEGKYSFVCNVCPDFRSLSFSKEADLTLFGGMNEYIIYMPLYSGVSEFNIGILPEYALAPPSPHKIEKPFLFYGSSITQGGCASRPGTSYTSILARKFDVPIINFGFSGNAKGELAMAEIIASIDASCFIYDYDHNSPTPEHLQKTHKPFFDLYRSIQPDTPIIIVSHPYTGASINNPEKRFEIIKNTYTSAVNSGDKNVYFVNGYNFFSPECRSDFTVDGCHPTDLGFYFMAKHIAQAINHFF